MKEDRGISDSPPKALLVPLQHPKLIADVVIEEPKEDLVVPENLDMFGRSKKKVEGGVPRRPPRR
jgi:hypothetical protein